MALIWRLFALLLGVQIGCVLPIQKAFADRPFTINVGTTVPACVNQTQGTLTVNASIVRTSGISPLLVFFDATATTDTGTLGGIGKAFNDLSYTWNFGDSGPSGTGTWNNGAQGGTQSWNTDAGPLASHLYRTSASATTDSTFQPTLTVRDLAGNVVTCAPVGTGSVTTVTAYAPLGSNGFTGGTVCVGQSTAPVPGSGGCPATATAMTQANANTALGSALGNKKQVLFRCGDQFSVSAYTANATTYGIGAFGTCVDQVVTPGNSQGMPVFNNTSGTVSFLWGSGTDGRIANIDIEGHNTASGINDVTCTEMPYQDTVWNVYENQVSSVYATYCQAQSGVVVLVMNPSASANTAIGFYPNNAGMQAGTGKWGSPGNINYNAFMGMYIDTLQNIGASNTETFRASACIYCIISHNTLMDASNSAAVLKFHEANNCGQASVATWCSGQYTQFVVIRDNKFMGHAGGQQVELEPQNPGDDERLQNIIVEANLFYLSCGCVSVAFQSSAVNLSFRNNIFYVPAGLAPNGSNSGPFYLAQFAQRGVEPQPTGVEAYNNTGNDLSPNTSPGVCLICFTNDGSGLSASNSFGANNLFYSTVSANGQAAVNNSGSGTGNTIANNTATVTNNPNFSDGSGGFTQTSDYKPSANYTGAAGAPVFYDALATLFPPTWNLGAIKAP